MLSAITRFQPPAVPRTDQPRIVDLDTEFAMLEGRMHFVSAGLIRGDQELYVLHPRYEELRERCMALPDQWLAQNVFRQEALTAFDPIIPGDEQELSQLLLDFCGEAPIFWMYCGDYDAVAFREAILPKPEVVVAAEEGMLDCPKTWPYTHMDLAFPLRMAGLGSTKDFPQDRPDELPAHNPLADARWSRRVRLTLLERAQAGLLGPTSAVIADYLTGETR